MLNSVTNNNVIAAPIQKQAVQNSTNSGSNFQQTLNEQTAITQATPQKATHIDVMANASAADSKASSIVDFTNMTPTEFGELTK